jgi:hypothetical protein
VWAAGAGSLLAQEPIKESLAGERMAETLKHREVPQDYNLKLGPILFQFDAGFGVEYNDNVGLSNNDRKDDIILRPHANMKATWPVSQLNTLTLNVGVAYDKYLFNSSADTRTMLISPDSELSFDIFIGDFRINLHDRFSLQQDPVDQPTLSNVTRFGRFENEAGITVDWDLNDVVLTLGYDHGNYISLTDAYSYLDHSSETVFGRAAFKVNPELTLGLQASGTLTDYDQNFQNDAMGFTVGPFVEWMISQYLSASLSGGLQGMYFDDGGTNGDTSNNNGFFADFSLNHRLNQYLTHTLSVGHEARLGLTSNFVEMTYIRHMGNWNILRDVTVGSELFYEMGEESGGFAAESLRRYGGGVSLGYQLTKHLHGALVYRYVRKESDISANEYYQNRVGLDFTYRF